MAGVLTCGSSLSRTFPARQLTLPSGLIGVALRLQLRGQFRSWALARTEFPFISPPEGFENHLLFFERPSGFCQLKFRHNAPWEATFFRQVIAPQRRSLLKADALFA